MSTGNNGAQKQFQSTDVTLYTTLNDDMTNLFTQCTYMATKGNTLFCLSHSLMFEQIQTFLTHGSLIQNRTKWNFF